MNLAEYRASPREKARLGDLEGLIPKGYASLLDIGARDGYMSIALVDYFHQVIALDLERPVIEHEKVITMKGDLCSLNLPDNAFDVVLCAEVLEHIPKVMLQTACSELARVTKHYLIIGVPYKQDLRAGRTTCQTCGQKNPPWGHVNQFDETVLKNLFNTLECEKLSFVGSNRDRTNILSTILMDWAGNPYGTYQQEELCVFCESSLGAPPERNLFQKICTRIALNLNKIQAKFAPTRPNWIHIRFHKHSSWNLSI